MIDLTLNNSTNSQAHDLWLAAYEGLDDNERAILDAVQPASPTTQQNVLTHALNAAQQKKTECINKRWKLTIGGKKIVLRDIFEKIVTWIDGFLNICDSIMQWQSPQVTLPWTAIRILLEASVNDVHAFGSLVESLERLTNLLTRCSIIENLCLKKTISFIHDFKTSLTALYTVILKYLVRSIEYFGRNTAKRILTSAVFDANSIQEWWSPIDQRQKEISKMMDLIQAERLDSMEKLLRDVQQDEKEQTRLMLSQFDALERPILRIDESLKNTRDDLEEAKRVRVLNAISKVRHPVQHKAARSGRLEHSGRWLLQKPAFAQWQSDSSSSVLWLHGIPGSGKTKLTSMVVDELRSSCHLAYFYCVRNPAEPERADSRHVLASYVRQLACTIPKGPLLEPVRRKHDEYDEFDGFDEQSWDISDCTEVLTGLADQYPSVTFVLDALDEVESTQRSSLVNAFMRIIENSSGLVKVFISSRNHMDIVRQLQHSPNLYIHAEDNSEDIRRFVERRLEDDALLNGDLSTELRQELIATLSEKAHGMFRWVDLQINALRQEKSASDIQLRLTRLPETLEDSYWQIFEQILRLGPGAQGLAILTIQFLMYAKQSIPIPEFVDLVSVQLDQQFTSNQILDICSNLVIVDGNMFRFAHLSVREFFELLPRPERDVTDFLAGPAHKVLATTCIKYLISRLNVAALSTGADAAAPYSITDAKDVAVFANQMPYATGMWIDHATVGRDAMDETFHQLLHDFLITDGEVSKSFKAWCSAYKGEAEAAKRQVADSKNPILLVYTFPMLEPDEIVVNDEVVDKMALYHAASAGNMNLIRMMIDRRGDAAYRRQALHGGIAGRHVEVVEYAIEVGIHAAGSHDLFMSVSGADSDIVRLLLKAFYPSVFSKNDLTRALTIAVSNGDAEIVLALEQSGAERERVAVFRATRNGLGDTAVNLIKHGYDAAGQYGIENRAPLHWASESGKTEVVEHLLTTDVPVDAVDDNDETALHLAARHGHKTIAQSLLQAKSDPSPKNIYGCTPLDLAIHFKHSAIAEMLSGQPEVSVAPTDHNDADIHSHSSLTAGFCQHVVVAQSPDHHVAGADAPTKVETASGVRAESLVLAEKQQDVPSRQVRVSNTVVTYATEPCLGMPALCIIAPTPPDSRDSSPNRSS